MGNEKLIGVINSPKFGKIKIHVTSDYSIFNLVDDNRDIKELHVRRLFRSISKEELFTVILVNEDMQIIDGQHRLKAFQLAKLPITYGIVKNYNSKEVILYNITNKNWSMSDYLDHYCKHSIESYLMLRHFANKYNIAIQAALDLIHEKHYIAGPNARIIFKRGDLKIGPETYRNAENFITAVQKLSFKVDVNLLKAFVHIVAFNKSISIEKLIADLNPKVHFIQTVSGKMQNYLQAIERAYNYRKSNKTLLYDHLKFN